MGTFSKGEVVGSLNGEYRVVLDVDEQEQVYEMVQLTETFVTLLGGEIQRDEIGTKFRQAMSVVDRHFALFTFKNN